MHRNTWAIVLAGGEGSRLRALTTTPDGRSVPKQFCSLRGGATLLEEAIHRAHRIADPTRVCPVVAAQHAQFWEPLLRLPDPGNLIVQPRNLGTAHGVLLPLLQILARDPQARVVLLPSDHHVSYESRLARSLNGALQALCGPEIVLLGIEPEHPDPELGYIVPVQRDKQTPTEVREFVEKPSVDHARILLQQGALWNAFIVVGHGSAYLDMFGLRYPEVLAQVQAALGRRHQISSAAQTLSQLYERLPPLDFSRDILQGAEDRLRVLRVPRCGWSDLGTPARVASALQRRQPRRSGRLAMAGSSLVLALEHARIHHRASTFDHARASPKRTV